MPTQDPLLQRPEGQSHEGQGPSPTSAEPLPGSTHPDEWPSQKVLTERESLWLLCSAQQQAAGSLMSGLFCGSTSWWQHCPAGSSCGDRPRPPHLPGSHLPESSQSHLLHSHAPWQGMMFLQHQSPGGASKTLMLWTLQETSLEALVNGLSEKKTTFVIFTPVRSAANSSLESLGDQETVG